MNYLITRDNSLRAALTYSGQPRDIESTWSNHKKYLIKPLIDQGFKVDIFCHFWFDKNEIGQDYVEGSYLIGRIQETTEMFLKKELKPLKLVLEKPTSFDFIDLVPDQRFPHPIDRTLSMFKSWNSVSKELEEYEKDNNFQYDIVFRMRTDLVFHNTFPESKYFDLNNLYVLNRYAHLDYGIDDTFAFSSSENIKTYYDLINNLDEITNLGAAINPETLLGYYISNFLKLNVEKLDLNVKIFRVSYLRFSKIRTLGEILKFIERLKINLKLKIKKMIKHNF